MANATPNLNCCIDCQRAELCQYDFDPIIAECDDGQKYVARAPFGCRRFKLFKGIRCIENRPKKIGI